MTTSLEIAKTTVARATQSYVRNGTSYCQTFAGNYWETFFGRQTPNSYATATAAYNASTIVSKDWNTAPPGAYHYFKYGTAGHVGVALGSGMMASATGWSTGATESLGKGVWVHAVSVYAGHLAYLGWAYTNGNRTRITGLTDPYVKVTAPNQRLTAVESRRRSTPSTSGSYAGDQNFPPNTVVTPQGWVNGDVVDGTSVWFKIDNLYTHSSTFTDRGTHDLSDLNTYAGKRVVLGTIANSRVRADASTTSEQKAILAPNEVVPVTQWKKGEKVTSDNRTTDAWFAVPGGYAWAGSFTDSSTNGLTEIKPAPQPDPIDYTRKVVGTQAVNIRKYPTTTSTLAGSIPLGTEIIVSQYTTGDQASSTATGVTSNIWYIVPEGVAWSGAFDSQSVEGLAHIDITIPAQKYPTEKFTFTTDLPSVVTRVVAADWSNFENEYSQPDVTLRKGFPLKPAALVRHQWGAPSQFSLESVLNTFQARHENSGDKVAPHFTVGINTVTKAVEIIQNVPLSRRAYHAGTGGNDYVGIEIDPRMTDGIIEAQRKLEEALSDYYGGRLPAKYHQDLEGANTACGLYIKPYAATLDTPFPDDSDETPLPDGDAALILAAIAAAGKSVIDAIGDLPTAEENGAAARSAIVKD